MNYIRDGISFFEVDGFEECGYTVDIGNLTEFRNAEGLDFVILRMMKPNIMS